MKLRRGFSLMELMVAIIIFGFMSAAMAAIYSTANRQLFQDYRGNMLKGNITAAMRAIGNAMATATRIDAPCNPAVGACGVRGNILALASNVDQLTGCYPINSGTPVTLHYFCTVNANLWYNFRNIGTPAACACPTPTSALPATCTNTMAYPTACGSGGSGTWIMLVGGSPGFFTAALNPYPFSRLTTGSSYFPPPAPNDVDDLVSVRVRLTGGWTATGNLANMQHDETFTLDSTFSANRSK